MRHEDLPEQVNKVSADILDACIAVHRELGPGLLESLYEEALTIELQHRGHIVRRQVPIPIEYKGVLLDGGLRVDMMVDDLILVEVKAVDGLPDVAFAQTDSYLYLTQMKLAILVNFCVPLVKDGYHRRVPRQKSSASLRASAAPQ